MKPKLVSYICSKCRVYVRMESENSKCDCKEDKSIVGQFKPFYSEECKTFITSSRHMDRVYKKHGLRPLGDAPFRKKLESIQKNKEEYIQQRYKREMNMDYKPGSDVRFSDKRKEFIPTNLWMREKAMNK